MHIEKQLAAIEKKVDLLFSELKVAEKLTEIATKLDRLVELFGTTEEVEKLANDLDAQSAELRKAREDVEK